MNESPAPQIRSSNHRIEAPKHVCSVRCLSHPPHHHHLHYQRFVFLRSLSTFAIRLFSSCSSCGRASLFHLAGSFCPQARHPCHHQVHSGATAVSCAPLRSSHSTDKSHNAAASQRKLCYSFVRLFISPRNFACLLVALA